MTVKFTRVPGAECTAAAQLRIEGFTPGDKSLDVVLYACDDHEDEAWENWGFSELWKYRKPYEAKGQTSDHRCGDLVDFRDENADQATADVSMPRDPVELEEQLAAAYDSVGEAVEARLDAESKEELTLFGTMLRLEINGELAERGSLEQIRAAVADLVTGWLADDPEGLAADAQTCNLAFNTGAVQEAIDLRGEWYTVVGMHSEHQTMRVRITKEG